MSKSGRRLDEGEISALAEEMERDLGVIRRALRKPLDAQVARGGLTAPQVAIMRVVVRSDGISLKELSLAVSLAHSTVSGIVDRLQKRGFIERRADAKDGRISRVHPTNIVKEFIREEIPALRRRPLEAALGRANQAERAAIGNALRRLRELLQDA